MSEKLPQNWETERAVLGGLLLNADHLDEVRGILSPEHFHRPAHRDLFRLMCELADRGTVPDETTVLDQVEILGKAEAFGGVASILSMPSACAYVENTPVYARRVRLHFERRDALLALEEAKERLLTDPGAHPAEVIAEAQARADRNVGESDDDWIPLVDAAEAAHAEIARRAENADTCAGIPTGFPDLDKRIGGWRGGRVYVLAARPKCGKSALCQQTATYAAARGYGVGFVSLEMDRVEMGERALANEARFDAGRLLRGEVDRDGEITLGDALERLRGLPFYLSDRPAQNLAQIRAKAKRLRARCEAAGRPLGLLVIDYLQLMGGDEKRNATREGVVAAMSRGIKLLAKEMNIPIILLSQLNRQVESRAEKRPMPSDLRESGAIEQDADAVIFLHREEVYNPETPKKGICEVIVSVIRGGQPGTVELVYIGNQYRFASIDQRHDPPPRYRSAPPPRDDDGYGPEYP
jgi:replicative DNA helicase